MTVGTVWKTKGMTSTARQDWETPLQLFYFLNKEFDFYLDVCATTETAKCPQWLGERSLELNWSSLAGTRTIWMNPPYGREVGKWIRKAWEESQRGATVVCLVAARTDTNWWHDYCMKAEIRFLRGRLRFDNDRRGRAPFPSAIVIFRPPQWL